MAAEYEIRTTPDGIVFARTRVSWSRSFGKCRRQDFHRDGEIFTQARLRAWGKKYAVTIAAADLARLPKKVWWQD